MGPRTTSPVTAKQTPPACRLRCGWPISSPPEKSEGHLSRSDPKGSRRLQSTDRPFRPPSVFNLRASDFLLGQVLNCADLLLDGFDYRRGAHNRIFLGLPGK